MRLPVAVSTAFILETVETASGIECTEDTSLKRVVTETAAVELHSTSVNTTLEDITTSLSYIARIRTMIVIFRVSNL